MNDRVEDAIQRGILKREWITYVARDGVIIDTDKAQYKIDKLTYVYVLTIYNKITLKNIWTKRDANENRLFDMILEDIKKR